MRYGLLVRLRGVDVGHHRRVGFEKARLAQMAVNDGAGSSLQPGIDELGEEPARKERRVSPFSLMHGEGQECVAANRKFQASTSKGISQGWPLAWLNDLTLYGPAAVVDSDQKGSLNYAVAQYMMR